MDNLSCAVEKIFEPNATGACVFRFDCIFWSGLSTIMMAYPALLKLASVNKTSCLPGMGCFSDNSQTSLRAFLTESKNVSFNSDVMLIGTSILSTLNIASKKSTAGIKTRLFSSSILISTNRFLISTSRILIWAEAFRNDYIATCSTALRIASMLPRRRNWVAT